MVTTSAPAVEICLTGTDDAAGYAAFMGEGKWVGDAENKTGRTLEEAFWLAVARLRVAGIVEGEVLVVDPTSRWVAEIAHSGHRDHLFRHIAITRFAASRSPVPGIAIGAKRRLSWGLV